MQKNNTLPPLETTINGEKYRFHLRETSMDEQDLYDQRWSDILPTDALKNKLRFNLIRDFIGEFSVKMPEKINSDTAVFEPIADDKTGIAEAVEAHFKDFSDKRGRAFLLTYFEYKGRLQEEVRFL